MNVFWIPDMGGEVRNECVLDTRHERILIQDEHHT